MTKPTVSIGIPAFNEGNNIGFLIQELLDQTTQDYELKSIVVASDASTDNTDSVVQSFNNEKVKLIPNAVRQGQAAKQNQIIEACETDILVLLNGDILLEGKDFIGNLVRPIIPAIKAIISVILALISGSFLSLLYCDCEYPNMRATICHFLLII